MGDDEPRVQHKATADVNGRFVCKDTCPRDDCEEQMKKWNGE